MLLHQNTEDDMPDALLMFCRDICEITPITPPVLNVLEGSLLLDVKIL